MLIAPRPVTNASSEPPPLPNSDLPKPTNSLTPEQKANFRASMAARDARKSPPDPADKPLTAKQRRFVFEYLSDPSRHVMNAARRAGYAETTAVQAVSFLMALPHIKKIIEIEEKKLFKKLDITGERVIQNIATMAFANILEYVKTNEKGDLEVTVENLTEQQGLPIQELKVDRGEDGKQRITIKLVDKLAALSLLGKHLKIFEEQPAQNFISVTFLDKLMAGKASVADLGPAQIPAGIFDAVAEQVSNGEAAS